MYHGTVPSSLFNNKSPSSETQSRRRDNKVTDLEIETLNYSMSRTKSPVRNANAGDYLLEKQTVSLSHHEKKPSTPSYPGISSGISPSDAYIGVGETSSKRNTAAKQTPANHLAANTMANKSGPLPVFQESTRLPSVQVPHVNTPLPAFSHKTVTNREKLTLREMATSLLETNKEAEDSQISDEQRAQSSVPVKECETVLNNAQTAVGTIQTDIPPCYSTNKPTMARSPQLSSDQSSTIRRLAIASRVVLTASMTSRDHLNEYDGLKEQVPYTSLISCFPTPRRQTDNVSTLSSPEGTNRLERLNALSTEIKQISHPSERLPTAKKGSEKRRHSQAEGPSAKRPKNSRQRKYSRPPSVNAEDNQYRVERLERFNPKTNRYFVRWEGYPSRDRRWVSRYDIDQTLIDEYHQLNK